MKLVSESINEMSIKHLSGRTPEEILSKMTPSERKNIEARKHRQSQRTFPKGYKQMRVLDLIVKAGNVGVTRTEIARLYYEMSYGLESYASIDNAGYNSVNIQYYIYPYVEGKPTVKQKGNWRSIEHYPNNYHYFKNDCQPPLKYVRRYIINVKGLRKLAELHNKFKNIKIDPEPYV